MATWADVKANALKLGILLSDEDVDNVPLLATDAFGNFIPGPVTGMAQIVMHGQMALPAPPTMFLCQEHRAVPSPPSAPSVPDMPS